MWAWLLFKFVQIFKRNSGFKAWILMPEIVVRFQVIVIPSRPYFPPKKRFFKGSDIMMAIE
jgi:hypothetical protein